MIPGHIPPTTRADLEEFQRFTAELLASAQAAKKAGQTAEAAAKSIDLTAKYKGYTAERMGRGAPGALRRSAVGLAVQVFAGGVQEERGRTCQITPISIFVRTRKRSTRSI